MKLSNKILLIAVVSIFILGALTVLASRSFFTHVIERNSDD